MLLSILYCRDSKAHHIGSGFVTNKKGLFITAGHIIYNNKDQLDNLRVAFPVCENHSKLYKFKVLYYEYLDPIYQGGEDLKNIKPFHQDLALCRVMSYRSICKDMSFERTHFKIETKRPASDAILAIKGYYNSGRLDIVDDSVNLSRISTEDTQFEIKHRLISIVSKEDVDYSVDPDLLISKKKFNNCLTLNESTNHGVSGGPALNSNGEVVGYCMGGKGELHYCNVMCSKYIRRRYKHINDSWYKKVNK